MTKLYYRGMMADNVKPKIGRHARCLGIRPNIDIDVDLVPKDSIDERGYLQPSLNHDADQEMVEVAVRNTKGMSVSFSIDALPDFRKPLAFGGSGRDPLWQIVGVASPLENSDKITGDLEAVRDSATHVSIMPRVTMLLAQYEAALASTSNAWELV